MLREATNTNGEATTYLEPLTNFVSKWFRMCGTALLGRAALGWKFKNQNRKIETPENAPRDHHSAARSVRQPDRQRVLEAAVCGARHIPRWYVLVSLQYHRLLLPPPFILGHLLTV